uniref:Reverse transcriptase domain-containing protein n=1 Tax=Felis catus TaxID=9685 RepID=A0ABI7WG76_FELCA
MPVSIRQYPMSKEAHMGIQPHITRFLELGVLRPCRSPWNTPLLPVKKPGTRDYRPVQDLREVNKRTMDIHPTVPNPYNLLSTLSPDRTWYTVLDLKDAFFCLPLAPQSQELFAFEWRDPKRGISGQLTWTRLPQGFKNSPTLFDEALHRDLTDFRTQHPEVTLLQYVDDLLLAAPTKEACILGTRHLLRELGEKGYRASAKKAQICQTKALLLDTDRIQFGPPVTLNPATLLPAPEDQQSAHDCRQVLAETHGTREDLKDQELPDADHSWYTDGSSYIDSETDLTTNKYAYTPEDQEEAKAIGAILNQDTKDWGKKRKDSPSPKGSPGNDPTNARLDTFK